MGTQVSSRLTQPIYSIYFKDSTWLKIFGLSNLLYVHITRLTTNYTPISKYRLRFFLNSLFTYICSNSLSGMVHTGGESPQDRLGVVQTCEITLASAYVLRCLSATWSQLQMIGKSPRWE